MNKKFLLKIIAAVLLLLIVFTFVSKAVYTAKLPVVTFTSAGEKNLEHELTVAGELFYHGSALVRAPGSFRVEEIWVEKGEIVRPGQALFSVDITDKALEKKSLDLELLRAENSISACEKQIESAPGPEAREPYDLQLLELKAQRDIVLQRMKLLAETYPEDGVIRAEVPGIVDRIRIEPGDWLQEDQVCIETHRAGEPLCVRYFLSTAEAQIFQVPDNSRFMVYTVTRDELTGSDTLALETLYVRDRRNTYSEETGYLQAEVQLSEPEGNPVMSIDAQVIMLHGIFDAYRGVLPNYCIHRDAEGTYIMVIGRRKTRLGIQNDVKREAVTVIGRNDMWAAISGGAVNQVVATSTQPLSDGDIVVVEWRS